jgi:hypothetical protein
MFGNLCSFTCRYEVIWDNRHEYVFQKTEHLSNQLRIVHISAAGIAVADVGGEEFDEAKLRAIAGGGDEAGEAWAMRATRWFMIMSPSFERPADKFLRCPEPRSRSFELFGRFGHLES